MDLNKVKEFYETLEDEKIEQLALIEAAGLEPFVIPILIAEVKRRSLSPHLIEAIAAQTNVMSDSERKAFEFKILNLPCPGCGSSDSELEGSIIRSVMSFIILTTYKKQHVLSCKNCKKVLKKSALTNTLLLGWWGIPWGIFQTPHALIMTMVENKKQELISKQVLDDFIDNHKGLIKASWDSKQELRSILKAHNQSE
jgi:hypothetical protein